MVEVRAADAVPVVAGSRSESPERDILWALFGALDAAGVPYCVVRGYQGELADPDRDVDCLLPKDALPRRLAALLHEQSSEIGAELVQWHDPHYLILAATGPDGTPRFVRLDCATDLERAGRRFYDGAEVLAKRRDYRTWWAPAAAVEFAWYAVERVIKGAVRPADVPRLDQVFHEDPDGAAREVERLWGAECARRVVAAATSGDWSGVMAEIPSLRAEVLRRATRHRPLRTAVNRTGAVLGRARRWLHPTGGLHVVLVGPDGVGKSSVIDRVRRDLAPAFGDRQYFDTFAPSILGNRSQAVLDAHGPHALPPRSLPASVLKGLYWAVFYSLGYFATIYPALARSALAINHRYLIDAIVDPRRYRYAGPRWLLDLAWRLAHKPDLVILLDAPPEVVQARKQEVTFAETARQRDAFHAFVAPLPYGHVVDATQPLAAVVTDVDRIILRHLAGRVARRFGLDGKP